MALPAFTGLLAHLEPIAHLLGLDKKITGMGREQVEPRFRAAIPVAVARLEKDGHTAAKEGAGPEAERFRIRAAMYLVAKDALAHLLPKGANLAADFLRDRNKADDKVVAAVSPLIDEHTTTQEMVEKVVDAWLNLIF